jgi:hypothetical protein
MCIRKTEIHFGGHRNTSLLVMRSREAEIEYLSGFFCRYSNTVSEDKEAKASQSPKAFGDENE